MRNFFYYCFTSLAHTCNIGFAAMLFYMPYSQFHEITPKGELVKEYEFKARDLRVYAIASPNGKIVVLGGYKNQQKADIRKFHSIKKQYLESFKF